MTQSQLFSVAVRILGVFLLVQAVMQLPAGIVNGFYICWYGVRGGSFSSNSFVMTTLYPVVSTAIVSFLVFAAVGWYLVIGAPALFRLAGIKRDVEVEQGDCE